MSWSTKKISELFTNIKIGGTPSRGNSSYFGGGNLWVSIKDMQDQGVITETSETLSDSGVANSNCKLIKKGSLLFSFKLTVGRIAFAGCDLYTNEAIAGFDIDEADAADVDLDYLALVLPIAAAQDTTKNSMGAALLNKEKIGNLEIRLPSRQLQRKIAARLKAQLAEVEKARKAAQAQWDEVQILKSKALETVFTRADNWQTVGSVARVQSGYAFKSESFKRSGTRLLRNANILPGKVYWDDTVYLSDDNAQCHPSYVLHEGDVLISLDRPLISSGIKVARVQHSDLPALLLQRVGRFVLDPQKLDAGYLYAYLQTELFIAQISGHEQSLGVPHISPGQVEAALIPLPDLVTQKEMAKRLAQITAAWSDAVLALKNQLDDLKVLPQRLLAQVFDDREET
jgi:type I restriction enzyme S subunit